MSGKEMLEYWNKLPEVSDSSSVDVFKNKEKSYRK